MLKESIRYPLIVFPASLIAQLIFYQTVDWIDTIGVCSVMFLFILVYNWTKTPYDWNKHK